MSSSPPGRSPSKLRTRLANSAIAVATTALVVPILAEVVVRAGIAMGLQPLRNPELYADQYSGEDYWKLLRRWNPLASPAGDEPVPHPTLGWAPRTTRENPLGVVASRPYETNQGPGTVLFFGDSFTAGVSLVPIEERVPQQLDDLLEDRDVYNFGVGGYGVDQIYLRMLETIDEFEMPYVVFGLLTQDLDRSVLTFFSNRPKPWLELGVDGNLQLKGTPVPSDPVAWLDDHPPQIVSYAAALVGRSIQKAGAHPNASREQTYRREEKIGLNRAILAEAVRVCRERDLPIVFVVFYTRIELRYSGWREEFLHEAFTQLEVPFVDTKEALLRAANSDPEQASLQFYLPSNGHLNSQGSFAVAEAIAHSMTGRPISGVRVARNRELVQNPGFDALEDCTLPSWRMNATDFVRLSCGDGAADEIELVSGSKDGSALSQKISMDSITLADPLFTASLECKSSDPGAVALIVTAITKDEKSHRFSAEHPGDGSWRTLTLSGELPATNLTAIYVTVTARPIAKNGAFLRDVSLQLKL